MAVPETLVLAADADGIAEAARRILRGEPVAVPTETVYGLAADATNAAAVAAIYAAKGRPSFNPLIVHVPNLAAAEALGEFSATARALAEAHWPGPLTLVVPLRAGAEVAEAVSAGLPTVALRVPDHRVMQALLRAVGRPLAAPSANASGRISPTSAEHVLATLSGRIGMVLDGGETERGVESTIIAVEGERLRLLRPGPIVVANAETVRAGSKVQAPGMLGTHYAPRKPVRLNAATARDGEWLIGFGSVSGNATLSPNGDLAEAASRLFAALHAADAEPGDAIAVAPIPGDGIGAAINDRLRRASSDRRD